jgi:biopolymer transport protein TolQ
LNFWISHFVRATLMAKLIYISLAGLSMVAWAIIFRKAALFRKVARDNGVFLRQYRKSRRDHFSLYRHLSKAGRGQGSPLVSLFMRGCEEMSTLQDENTVAGRGDDGPGKLSILQIDSLEKILFMEMDRILGVLEGGFTFLATTASVSPFMGLLGTVWGILQAFKGVGVEGSAALATLAPGLAEALVTTVAGLTVAIPALIGYNFLSQKSRDLALEGDIFVTEFIVNIERFWGLK